MFAEGKIGRDELLAAESKEEARPVGLSETIDVEVVNVEAVVTDKSGTRISGLSADDFRLFRGQSCSWTAPLTHF